MVEEVLKYSVELDGSGIQSQLQDVSSAITGGLNMAYSGLSSGLGTVAMAGDTLQRDLDMMFSPSRMPSAMIGGYSTNMLGAQMSGGMGFGGGMIQQMAPPGFGIVQEFDMAVMGGPLRTSAQAVGGIARRFGISNRWGQKPRTMTETDYEALAEESWEERVDRFTQGAGNLGVATLIGTVGGGLIGLGLTRSVKGMQIGAGIGGVGGGLLEEPITEFFNPGQAFRNNMQDMSRGLRMGVGGERFDLGERKQFASAVEESIGGLKSTFSSEEIQQSLAQGVSSGLIKRRGDNIKEMSAEVKDYLQAVKEGMENLNVEFDGMSQIVSRLREQFGIKSKDIGKITAQAAALSDFTGLDSLQEMNRIAAVASGLEGTGMTAEAALGQAQGRIATAESMIKSGYITSLEARRLGGAAGASVALEQGQAMFRQTGLGNAMLMAGYNDPSAARAFGAGTISREAFLSSTGDTTLGRQLAFLGDKHRIDSDPRYRTGLAGVAAGLLGEMPDTASFSPGMIDDPAAVKEYNAQLAGVITLTVPGMDSVQATAIAKEYTMSRMNPGGSLYDPKVYSSEPMDLRSFYSKDPEKKTWRDFVGVLSEEGAGPEYLITRYMEDLERKESAGEKLGLIDRNALDLRELLQEKMGVYQYDKANKARQSAYIDPAKRLLTGAGAKFRKMFGINAKDIMGDIYEDVSGGGIGRLVAELGGTGQDAASGRILSLLEGSDSAYAERILGLEELERQGIYIGAEFSKPGADISEITRALTSKFGAGQAATIAAEVTSRAGVLFANEDKYGDMSAQGRTDMLRVDQFSKFEREVEEALTKLPEATNTLTGAIDELVNWLEKNK